MVNIIAAFSKALQTVNKELPWNKLLSPVPEPSFVSKVATAWKEGANTPRKSKPVATPTPMPTAKPQIGAVLGNAIASASPRPAVTASPTPTPISVGTSQYGRNPDTKIADPRVYDAITKAAKKFSLPPALLFDIAMQESTLGRNAGQNQNSSATGLFQFLEGTWNDTVLPYARNPRSSLYGVLPNEDRNDPYTNALATAYLIKMGQLGRWDESKGVWGNFWPDEELEQLGVYNQTPGYWEKKGKPQP